MKDSLVVGCMGPFSAHSVPNQITLKNGCHVCKTPCSAAHFGCSCIISSPTITEAHFSARLTDAEQRTVPIGCR